MKKYVLLAIALLLAIVLPGCCSPDFLKELPPGEFASFEYHRAGNATSADIVAKNAKRLDDGSVEIESVSVKADYGPFINFNINLEGYKREAVEKMDE